ncbi:hypothetical protein F5Y11DRAFT_344693 [Daldinia sp. FL1419]|nr:hypothetical protein F5Y11DRAFT_344693 [Daldinia sp. FL1419]
MGGDARASRVVRFQVGAGTPLEMEWEVGPLCFNTYTWKLVWEDNYFFLGSSVAGDDWLENARKGQDMSKRVGKRRRAVQRSRFDMFYKSLPMKLSKEDEFDSSPVQPDKNNTSNQPRDFMMKESLNSYDDYLMSASPKATGLEDKELGHPKVFDSFLPSSTSNRDPAAVWMHEVPMNVITCQLNVSNYDTGISRSSSEKSVVYLDVRRSIVLSNGVYMQSSNRCG